MKGDWDGAIEDHDQAIEFNPRSDDAYLHRGMARESKGDLDGAIANLLEHGLEALVVKRGAGGAEVHLRGGEVVAAEPFSVDVLNVLGAGDAFAAGLIYVLTNTDYYT